MEYDIFISHASQDEDQVKLLCDYLENKGLKCFVSYRDIRSGESYPGAITRALRESEMLLLVLSSESNESTQVDRELTLANDQKKKLSCFRLEDITYSDDKAYLMSGVNWLDAFPSPEEHYFELLQDVFRQLGRDVPQEEETEEARLLRYKNMLGTMLYHANEGIADAQYDLGWSYDQGRYGLKVDYEEAFRWMLKAAKNGHLKAENVIGVYFAEGVGVTKDMKEAFKWCRLAALGGNEVAQSNLAIMYRDGDITEKDINQAVKWWKLAADQGYDPAMVFLGHCYYSGEGVEQDFKQAVSYYSRAAELDNDEAQIHLANCYLDGEGIEKDIDKCLEILKAASENGSKKAMVSLAKLYEQGKYIEPNYEVAYKYVKSAAEMGDQVALYNLARFYSEGIGCEQDEKKWFHYLEMAANAGHPTAQDLLGDEFNNGNNAIGILSDPQKAQYWYQKAIDQGDTDAMVDLGLCYRDGGCLPLNDTKAVELFRQAAEMGNARGQFLLADRYQNGDGVEQSDIEAFNWCVKSADQEYPPAMALLGKYFFYGVGTEQNFTQAVEWLQKAADEGNSNAQNLLGICYEFGYGIETNNIGALGNYFWSCESNQKSKEALDHLLEKLTRLADNGDLESSYALGCYYAYLEEDNKRGLDYFLKLAEHGYVKAYNEIAWNYHLIGMYDEGLEWAEKAVAEDKNNANSYDTLASLYQDKKMYPESLSFFEKCLALYQKQGDDTGIEETKVKIENVKKELSEQIDKP